MTEDLPDKSVPKRIKELQRKRRDILALPPEQALNRILSDPQPAALVHSFPETDFYLLIHDIGPEDCLPLLALASDRQWDHVVDLESWDRDRIENSQVTRWLNLLLEADPKRFIRWFLTQRLSFVEFYLFHNIEVRVREHDQDPSDFGDDFFTLDNVFYLRFLKMPPTAEGVTIGEEQRRQFLTNFIERLAAHDHLAFQSVLFEATHVIPAETEEEEYRWRNVRLAEKGFLPFDEAVGIYQPVKPGDLKRRVPNTVPQPREEAAVLPVPAVPLREIRTDNPFSRALAALDPGDVLSHIQWEFSNLCNQIVVADRKSIRGREELREVVKKACGYLSIGLERLKESPQKELELRRAAQALTRYPLGQLFRLGFGAALELKWQAEKWLGSCWFGRSGLRLTFWGEQWMGVLGGVLLKKPLFYDNYQTGPLYREFASMADIASAERILRQIQAVDHLFSVMTIRLQPPSRYGFLTWKNLLLTLWARQRLGAMEEVLRPLALKPFSRFFSELLPGTPPATGAPRRIPDPMKTSFVQWLAHETGLKDFEITEKLGPIFEELFAEIEAEYGRVAAGDLDPRFVHLFLLKRSA